MLTLKRYINIQAKHTLKCPTYKFSALPAILHVTQSYLKSNHLDPYIKSLNNPNLPQERKLILRHNPPLVRHSWRMVLWKLNKGESHGFHGHKNVSSFHLIAGGKLRSIRYNGTPPNLNLHSDTIHTKGEGYCTFDEHTNHHNFYAQEDNTYLIIFSLRGYDRNLPGRGARTRPKLGVIQ